MDPHDEQAGERLWSHIEELLQEDPVGGRKMPERFEDLSSVASGVGQVMRGDLTRSDGRLQARARLLAVIEADTAQHKAETKPWFSLFWSGFRLHQRLVLTSLAMVLAISALAYEGWAEYQARYCQHSKTTSKIKP